MSIIHFIFARTWWTYDSNSDWYAQPYHWLNLFEGTVWLGFAMLVFGRYLRHHNSRLELLYSLAFVTFGLSDFREAYVLQSWLILFKGVNLTLLLYLRLVVMRRYYSHSKTF